MATCHASVLAVGVLISTAFGDQRDESSAGSENAGPRVVPDQITITFTQAFIALAIAFGLGVLAAVVVPDLYMARTPTSRSRKRSRRK